MGRTSPSLHRHPAPALYYQPAGLRITPPRPSGTSAANWQTSRSRSGNVLSLSAAARNSVAAPRTGCRDGTYTITCVCGDWALTISRAGTKSESPLTRMIRSARPWWTSSEPVDVDDAATAHAWPPFMRAHKNGQPYRLPSPLVAGELYRKYTTPAAVVKKKLVTPCPPSGCVKRCPPAVSRPSPPRNRQGRGSVAGLIDAEKVHGGENILVPVTAASAHRR